MPNIPRDRPLSGAGGRGALVLGLLLCAAACDTTTPATYGGAPVVLTGRGEPVRANSPPGIEVTLGSKRVLQAGEPNPLD
jgi:hypothetical protein